MKPGIALFALWVAACSRPATEPAGTLVLEVGATDTRDSIDARVANAIEVLQSRSFARRVAERRGPHTNEPVVHARRRADSTVIEVSVGSADPQEATELCNAAIMTFMELERAKQMMAVDNRAHAIAEQLDKLADDARRKQLADEAARLDLERRAMAATVRALDPCVLPRR